MSEPSSVPAPVAIVGSGPVGMMLAMMLSRLGVRSVLIEQDETTLWHPKGNTHNTRTMEHYRKLGLADEIRKLGLPSDYPTDVVYLTHMQGIELHRLEMPSTQEKLAVRDAHSPLDQIPEPLQRVNQMYVERLVSERVLADPLIEARYGWTLEKLEQDPEGVTIFIRNAEGVSEVIAADYLVGCDGPRSLVRETLGYKYVGEDSFGGSFMGGPMLATYVRLRSKTDRPVKPSLAWQYWLLRPDTVMNLVSLDGEDEFIFTAARLEDTSPEAIARTLLEVVGLDVDVEVLSSREWTAGRALVAEHYRKDRVFLCGDAIHLFTPTGGFGMNTGVDDAVNLAWKLAGTIQGWGGPGLLESYEDERRPIGVRNSGAARGHAGNIRDIKLSAAMAEDSAEGRAVRDAATAVLKSLKEEFASIGIQLGARYDDSTLVAVEAGEPPVDEATVYAPTSRPGGRAPHVWLGQDRSLFDVFGPGFTLLRFEPEPSADSLAAEAGMRGIPFSIVDIDLPEARALYPHRLALIRPDDYVAWRGDDVVDPSDLLDRVTGQGGGL